MTVRELKARRACAALLAVLALCAVMAPRADAVPAKASVVGGVPIQIQQAPWQIFLRVGANEGCGGSVLDATRVLTAAHCVVASGTTTPRPVSDFQVMAGFTDLGTWDGGTPPAGTQVVNVASVRVHPLYEFAPKTDDVAVLTLTTALNLSGPRIKAAVLAPVNGAPAPGAALSVTGYGAQVEGQLPDGRLYGATVNAITDTRCRPNIASNASASVLCATGANQGPCFADSGGPATLGGVQVGVISYGNVAGCGRPPAGFADVTAPETRAFIDGAAAVPIAPRHGGNLMLSGVNPPVHGSPMNCAAGSWTEAPAFAYTFVNEATGVALQSGASPTFVPTVANLGATVSCVVQAAGAGGTSIAWTIATPPLLRDAVRPRVGVFSVTCRKRRCSVRFGASDSNSRGALRIRVTAERRVRSFCGKGKKRRRCIRTKAKGFAVKLVKGTTYRATASRVPRGRATIRVRVTDGGGNRRSASRRVRVR